MEQLLARLAELKAEGDAIMQQLMSAGMPPEQIMAAVEGGGQPMPQPGMGAGPGPDLPPAIPAGPPRRGGNAASRGGINATNAAMGMGGGIPQGLLGVQ